MVETAREPRSLTQVLRDRVKPKKPTLQPTHIENLSLRVRQGIKIDPPKAAIRGIHRATMAIIKGGGRISKIEEGIATKKKILTDFAQDYPGFMGLESKDDNFVVSVYREAKVKYNDRVLKKALGAASTAVTREKLEVTFTLPLGHETEEGILTSERAKTHIQKAIEDLNFSKNDVKKLLTTNVVSKPDEPTLFELLDNGRVVLPPEAATVEDTLKVRITPIDDTLGMPPVA